MARVANGNLDILKILFDRHHNHVFNFLFKMSGDRMLSEDLTQEVFYKLMKYRTSYNNGKFVPWLFTIARNSMHSHFRNASKQTEELTILKFNPTINEAEQKDYSDLHLAINQLEASDRELVILNRIQEIKYEELAQIVGSTPGAVKTKVSRALKKLKTIYFQNS